MRQVFTETDARGTCEVGIILTLVDDGPKICCHWTLNIMGIIQCWFLVNTLQVRQVQFGVSLTLNLFILDVGSELRDRVASFVELIKCNTTLFVSPKWTPDVNVQLADLLCRPDLRAYDYANADVGKVVVGSECDPGNGGPLSKTAWAVHCGTPG